MDSPKNNKTEVAESAPQFFTYIHTKPNGEIFYVGKGCGNRAYKLTGRNSYHKNIVGKYGKKNIGIFIFLCDSEEQAFTDEIHQIAQLRKEGFSLANMTDGGEGAAGLTHSEETKNKLKELWTTSEYKAKMEARDENNKTNTGYPFIHLHKRTQRYEVKIKIDGKRIYFGSFLTLEEAIEKVEQVQSNYVNNSR